MLSLNSRVPLLQTAPQVFALSLALSLVAAACDDLPEPTSSSQPPSFDLAAPEILELIATSDDPRALQVPTTPLSESGADLYGVGGGQSNLGTQNFDLSAHTGPQGDFGHYGVKLYDLAGQQLVRYRVDVNCVHIHGEAFGVVGKRGVIKGVVDQVEPTPNALGVTLGETLSLLIKDDGEPSAGPVDDVFPLNFDVFPGLTCKNIFYVGDVNNVNQGNVRIKMD